MKKVKEKPTALARATNPPKGSSLLILDRQRAIHIPAIGDPARDEAIAKIDAASSEYMARLLNAPRRKARKKQTT